MSYAALNVVLACYAVKAFIGLRNSLVDVWIHGTSLLYKPDRRRRRLLGGCARRRRPAEVRRGRPTGGPCSRSAIAEPRTSGRGGRRREAPGRSASPAAPVAGRGRAERQLVAAAGARGGAWPGAGRRAATAATSRSPVPRSGSRGRPAPVDPPDLVRALRGRHAHADLPVPEHVRRPGPADRPRLRGRRPAARPAPRAGARPTRWPRPTSRSRWLPHRAGAAGRGAAHRVVRRPGQHQPRRRLHRAPPR